MGGTVLQGKRVGVHENLTKRQELGLRLAGSAASRNETEMPFEREPPPTADVVVGGGVWGCLRGAVGQGAVSMSTESLSVTPPLPAGSEISAWSRNSVFWTPAGIVAGIRNSPLPSIGIGSIRWIGKA